MNLFLRCVVFFLLISLAYSTAIAEKADDAQMAREAIAPLVGQRGIVDQRSTEDKARARINLSHDSIRSRAAENPSKDMSVAIVLGRGHSVEEVATLAKKFELEVIDLHLKTPYNDRGVVQSFTMGSAELARYEGDFSERARTAIGVIRYRLLTMAETMPDDVAREYRRMSKSELLVYRIEAYSRSPRIVGLLNFPQVAAVFAEPAKRGDEKIAFQKRMRSEVEAGWQRIRSNGDDIRAFREKHRDKLEEAEE